MRKYSGTKKASLTKEADSGSRLLWSYFWDTTFIYPRQGWGRQSPTPSPPLPNKLLFCQIFFKTNLYLCFSTFPQWSYRNLVLFGFPVNVSYFHCGISIAVLFQRLEPKHFSPYQVNSPKILAHFKMWAQKIVTLPCEKKFWFFFERYFETIILLE